MDFPVKSMNYRWQHDISGMILYNVKTERSYRLNETAFEVWNLCDGELSADSIINNMAERYSVKRADIQKDIEETLKYMKEKNMIISNEVVS